MPAPRPVPRSAPGPRPGPPPGTDAAREVIRWAVFSSVLVPVVLLWCGTAPTAAVGAGLGLAGATAVCRSLLVRSLRGAARGVADHTRASTPVD
ncbi:hypothetical protein ACIPPM_11685 [Streptomyces sp. NPDC090119]|uniref:hypothetical protein n=1 Tax=Streptomyces sp. NPDC090119 TaxID=3365951 RepID=UPI00380EB8EC